MESQADITKEFLEDSLKIAVDRFVINKGSNLGDGYTCLLYSVDVWRQGEEKPLPILIKCFPTNPVRQQMLEDADVFTVELRMYDTVIPELEKFKHAHDAVDIRLPFAPFFVGGQTPLNKRNGPAKQLDNYLIMTDLRKNGGFQLRDRFKGLDLDHFKLVIEGQATLHALSWVYKQMHQKKLSQIFPFLTGEGFADVFGKFLEGFNETLGKEMDMFKDEPKLVDALRYLRSVATPATKLYYNIPLEENEKHFHKDNVLRTAGKVVENEEPWEVLRHGDCWSNNLLFRYDPITGKPVEVVFIDLQICQEGDPFGDICYSMFCNTTPDVRRKHLDSLLHVYYDTFAEICERFSVAPLPGWSWEEFNRRFHRAQIVGMAMGAGGLPIMLQDPNEVKDLDKLDMTKDGVVDDDSVKELMNQMMDVNFNTTVKDRLRAVIEDGINAGII